MDTDTIDFISSFDYKLFMKNNNADTIFGYMGKALYIDMRKKSFKEEPLKKKYLDLLHGGRGFGIAALFEHFNRLLQKHANPFKEVDPLSGDNVIVLSTSAVTGTFVPTSGQLHMNFKSPLTNGLGSASIRGHLGLALKQAGYDLLVIEGMSDKPCAILITNGRVEFKNILKNDDKIKNIFSKKAHALSIGLGGRKKCRFASVITDSGAATGRSGAGAVFGSKNLYLLAVLPDPAIKTEVCHPQDLSLKNPGNISHIIKLKLDTGKFTKKERFFGILPSLGTLGVLGMIHHSGQLVHENMQDTDHRIEDINKISGEALRNHERDSNSNVNRIRVKKEGCYSCPILCKRKTEIIDSRGCQIAKGEGPEFESTALLGANLSIYNLELIVKANFLANSFGIDSISLGSTIASFLNLFQVVSKKKYSLTSAEKLFLEDVKDFVEEFGEPAFGNENILLPVINLIGQQEGIGKSLALGSYRFCRLYGHPELSMSVKKLELPGYDPRGSFARALCYETNNTGGCNLEGGFHHCPGYGEWPPGRIEGTPLISRNAALIDTSLDTMGFCASGSFSLGLDDYSALVASVTGQECNSGVLETIAERVITLERQFNIFCGLTKEDDILPERFYNEAIEMGGIKKILDKNDFSSMRQDYYKSFGWDQNGVPQKSTLKTLLIDKIVNPSQEIL